MSGALIPKPAEGAPCNGCGLCCIAEPCGISLQLGATAGQSCPFLIYEEARFWCGVIKRPLAVLPHLGLTAEKAGALSEAAADALGGVGGGCDSDAPAGLTILDAFRLGDGAPP